MALARRSYFISVFKPYLQMTNQQSAENILYACMYMMNTYPLMIVLLRSATYKNIITQLLCVVVSI